MRAEAMKTLPYRMLKFMYSSVLRHLQWFSDFCVANTIIMTRVATIIIASYFHNDNYVELSICSILYIVCMYVCAVSGGLHSGLVSGRP